MINLNLLLVFEKYNPGKICFSIFTINFCHFLGHQVVLCPHVIINSSICRGYLHKKGSKLNGWSRRWFVFDRNKHTFAYYLDKSEKKARGGAYFQVIYFSFKICIVQYLNDRNYFREILTAQ